MSSVKEHFRVSKASRGSSKKPPALATQPGSATDEADKQTLLAFDFNSQFGPFSGLTRMQRWQRADAAALDPPPQVRELLLRYGLDSPYNQPVMSARDGS